MTYPSWTRVSGTAEEIAAQAMTLPLARRLPEVAFADLVDRLAEVGRPVSLWSDGSWSEWIPA